MTGTRSRRARQLTAVAVLSLMLAALPATAWADHGHRGGREGGRDGRGQSHDQVERGRTQLRLDAKVGRLGVRVKVGGGRDEHAHDKGRAKHDRRDERRAKPGRDDKHRRDDRRATSEPASRATRNNDLVVAANVRVGPSIELGVQRRAAQPGKQQAERSQQQDRQREQSRDRQGARGRERAARERQQAARQREQAAREQAARQRERAAREQADREREQGERYRRDDRRERLELDRAVWGASTEAQREQERLDRELRRWLDTVGEPTSAPDEPAITPDEPQRDDTGTAATTPTPTDPPTGDAAEPAPSPTTTESALSTAAPATPGADLLAHQRGVVGRTFEAGGELLRETGRAVVSAIPPRARRFSIPAGLLAAIAAVLVVQRRFRPGTLPMSAASVPEQEGARERHRL